MLDPDDEGRGFTATVPVLPGCISEGETVELAIENIKDAIEGYIAALAESAEEIPVETRPLVIAAVDVETSIPMPSAAD